MSEKAHNTLAGLLQLNDANLADIYPTLVLDESPVIAQAFTVPASQGGTLHKYLRRHTAATASFREINTGVTNEAEKSIEVSEVCKFWDPSFTRDVALAAGYRGGLSAYVQRETAAALKTGFFGLERAFFNNALATQFTGLLGRADYTATGAAQVVNAGGAGGKSVWLLRWAEDGVALVAGNDGRIDMIWDDDNPTIVQVAGSGGVYSAYRVTLGGYFAQQIGATKDVARICNLDGTQGNTLTDDMIYDAMSRFASGRGPNMIVMNQTALKELRESRTATNATGAPAPVPREVEGVPIVTTDALVSNETTVDGTTGTTTTTTTTTA